MLEHMAQIGWAVRAVSGDSSDSGNDIAYVFLLAGFVFYGLMFLRYRNVNKRHHYESETKAEMADVRAADTFSRSLTGLSNSRMHGANNTSVRGSLTKYF